ncbi:MAG: hypothetical protein LBU57_09010 [Dysgonamonadaceae bacterium]|jgi:N-acetylneuraminic acid mutarotase|nr:hypothetical protein [Dysgonamonadaceae bacterium]
MKKINLFCIFILFCAFSCLENVDMPKERQNVALPELKMEEISDLKYNGATINANIESANGYKIISRGFILGLNSNPRNGGDSIPVLFEGDGTGKFSHQVEELKTNTTYYYMAYAVNSKGIQYSDISSFRTWTETPTVRTGNAQNVADGNAIFQGDILSEGASPIIECGICWSTVSERPLYNVNNTYISPDVEEHFSTIVSKMAGGITYYFRAFAINGSHGISYGETVALSTPPVWEKLPSFPGGGRLSPTTFTLLQNFYVATGEAENTDLQNSVWEFNPSSGVWQEKTGFPGIARKGASSFVIDNKTYLGFGTGNNGGIYSFKDFRSYLPNQDIWNPIEMEFPSESRGYSPAFSLNNTGYVVGGQNYPAYETLSEVWTYRSVGGSGIWTQKKPFPIPIMGGIAFTSNDRAFIGLGKCLNPDIYYNEIWEYNLQNDTWKIISTVPDDFKLAEGEITNVTVIEQKAYIIDGINQVWIFDLITEKWEQKSIMPGDLQPNQCMFSRQHDIFVGLKRNSPIFYKYRPFWDNPITP